MNLKSLFRQSTALFAAAAALGAVSVTSASADETATVDTAFFQGSSAVATDSDDVVYGVAARAPAAPVNPTHLWTGSVVQTANFNQSASTIAAFGGTETGAGVIVGVVDSGLDLDHPQFTGRVLTGTCLGSASVCNDAWSLVGGDSGISPTATTHGTHVAGIIAGSTVGIAKGASILPVKVCLTLGNSCPGDVSGGVLWAAQHGAKVINISISGLAPLGSATSLSNLAGAVSLGALITTSGGNSGNAQVTADKAGLLTDGIYGAAILVGSLGAPDGGNPNGLSAFSQTPGTYCLLVSGQKRCLKDIWLVAPGQGIISTVGGVGNTTGSLSGTSMAAPFVAGVAALVLQNHSWLSPYDVAEILFESAVDLGAAGDDRVFGQGMVDADAAVAAIGSVSLVASVNGGSAKTGNLQGAFLSGPMATGLRGSTLLGNVVGFDKFRRDFHYDARGGAVATGFRVGDVLEAANNVEVNAFAGSFGGISFSGSTVEDTTMGISELAMQSEDIGSTDVQNLLVAFKLSSDVDVRLGMNMSMGGQVSDFDAASSPAYNGLFFSAAALSSPYASIADGGNMISVGYQMTDSLHVRTSLASYTPDDADVKPLSDLAYALGATHRLDAHADRSADVAAVTVDWTFARWGGLGLTATHVTEENGILGGDQAGAFSIADTASTSAIGVSGRVSLGDGWIASAAWSEGTTSVDTLSNSIVQDLTDIHSRAYGLALSKIGVFGDSDTLGLAISRPLHVVGGTGELAVATGVTEDRDYVFGSEQINFGSGSLQTDYELGYTAMLLDGAMALQTSAAYQENVGGLTGEDGFAVVTRMNFGF